MANILVFGDSIGYGCWDQDGGWVARLRKDLDQRNLEFNEDFYYEIYNLSIDGDQTTCLLDRFENEIKVRLSENGNTIIIALGINDSAYVRSKKDRWVTENLFRKNLQELIDQAKKYTPIIVFVGPTPVEQNKVDPMPWDLDKSCLNINIKKYNQIIKKICQENKIHFIEIIEKFHKNNLASLLTDGVHPNSKGHKLIYEIVKKYLISNKIIPLNI